MSELIQAEQLAEQLAENPKRYVVLAVHWKQDPEAARAEYDEAHLDGAIYVDGVRAFGREPREGEGRNPLPDVEVFQETVRGWGVREGDRVLVYDRTKNAAATRAWWVLTHSGIDVTLLDGGLNYWQSLGLPVTTDEPRPTPSDITISYGSLPIVTADDVQRLLDAPEAVVIDARNPHRFAGEPDPLDPRPGHAPGAVNAWWEEQLRDDGRLQPAEKLRETFEALGVAPGRTVANYCGSGVSATLNIFALAVAGYPRTALYPGSWSEWAANEHRPIVS